MTVVRRPANFFELQQRARRRTRLLLPLIVAAILATTVIVDLLVWSPTLLFHMLRTSGSFVFTDWVVSHGMLLAWPGLFVLGAITISTLIRLVALRRGGVEVARSLDAVLIEPDTLDLPKRQLINIVEETAIGAGIPVPQVYLLEQEHGFNALTAGYTSSDAIIAITRGALEGLSRDELSGLVAHEMSHIVNGDTRLNMRLLGGLSGLISLALLGRSLRDWGVVTPTYLSIVVVIIGWALFLIGSIGMLLGAAVRAAISREREFLADACAVQTTRNPVAIAGVLKRVAAAPASAILRTVNSEEVSHMLIVDGGGMFRDVFATHPPLIARIRALDPYFDVEELAHVKPISVSAMTRRLAPAPAVSTLSVVSPAAIVASMGGIATPEALAASIGIPEVLRQAARSRTEVASLMLALVLSKNAEERDLQLTRLRRRLPETLTKNVVALIPAVSQLEPVYRLPLLESALPALRQRAAGEIEQLIAAIDDLCRADGEFDLLDYTLTRLLRLRLTDVAAPTGASARVIFRPQSVRTAAALLFAVVARAGQSTNESAEVAYQRGMRHLLGAMAPSYATVASTPITALDGALMQLDCLIPMAKQTLVEALTLTILGDGTVTLGEIELLRVVCANLHCPVPPLIAERASPVLTPPGVAAP